VLDNTAQQNSLQLITDCTRPWYSASHLYESALIQVHD